MIVDSMCLLIVLFAQIDIWSLGCILAELWTGNVLFLNDSIVTLLARIVAIVGPFPKEMLQVTSKNAICRGCLLCV